MARCRRGYGIVRSDWTPMDDRDTPSSLPAWEALYGPNVGYALELYERYLHDPGSVDAETRTIFDRLERDEDRALATLARPSSSSVPNGKANGSNGATPAAVLAPTSAGNGAAPAVQAAEKPTVDVNKVVLAARMARSIREYGHLAANIDPLGSPRPGDPMLEPATHGITDVDLAALPASIVWPSAGPEDGTCLDAIEKLREMYCGSIGYEFDHVQDYTERTWLHDSVESGAFRQPMTADERRALLQRLTEVEGFEQFLHTTFQGQRRFSIEGNDMLVPMLDEIIRNGTSVGLREVLIGMAHRGRLNVLAHVLAKPYPAIFSEFHATTTAADEGVHAPGANQEDGWTGDVKYHLGAQRTIEGQQGALKVTVADNPSHLEVVDPVVAGFARAAQDNREVAGPPRQDPHASLPVTIHGDAAFPGEGVVAETLNLSRLPGFQTGGSLRIITNNQIGFTTESLDSRSTLYASDLAKGFEIPIVHVNADDPEACIAMIRFAFVYRERFGKDFLIDLVGYRRWGHNESDEPAFTQPLLYNVIRSHPTVRAVYAERLQHEGIVTADEVEQWINGVRDTLREAREQEPPVDVASGTSPVESFSADAEHLASPDELREINAALLTKPEGFTLNRNLERILSRRVDALDRPGGIDWALAESLAFGTILRAGTPIRMTGQDTERGTFSQRHLVLHDLQSGDRYVPLQTLPGARASFAVYNSPLTETAVLGFEYGYSVHAPEALVVWEAQFGDFANVGQVIVDQFISAARAKWRRTPALTMLLPHAYEGQGPEHSSARLERYLQLAAEDNIRVANVTTAAQYYHLLRLQAELLSGDRRPLVIMTPKSLLRHPRAASSLGDLVEQRFQPVLDDWGAADRHDRVTRLILCSGKVAVDLSTTAAHNPEPLERIAVARIELLYPFPEEALQTVLAGYPNLKQVVWVQEEPRNQGAWQYIAPRIEAVLPAGVPLHYLGRSERAATAVGSGERHGEEQSEIVGAAFEGERRPDIGTHGVQYVD
jgi:2-oxoglutarate dehydrogenase E1 component